jgi:hypothetical protein
MKERSQQAATNVLEYSISKVLSAVVLGLHDQIPMRHVVVKSRKLSVFIAVQDGIFRRSAADEAKVPPTCY